LSVTITLVSRTQYIICVVWRLEIYNDASAHGEVSVNRPSLCINVTVGSNARCLLLTTLLLET